MESRIKRELKGCITITHPLNLLNRQTLNTASLHHCLTVTHSKVNATSNNQ